MSWRLNTRLSREKISIGAVPAPQAGSASARDYGQIIYVRGGPAIHLRGTITSSAPARLDGYDGYRHR
jgi:hypothetical protein